MPNQRSAFQQQVVEALIATKAINFEAVGATMSKFGERAAREGEPLVTLVNPRVMWACGWPVDDVLRMREQAQQAG